jgi:hypothetical protein
MLVLGTGSSLYRSSERIVWERQPSGLHMSLFSTYHALRRNFVCFLRQKTSLDLIRSCYQEITLTCSIDLAGWVRLLPETSECRIKRRLVRCAGAAYCTCEHKGLSRPLVTAWAAGTLGAPWQRGCAHIHVSLSLWLRPIGQKAKRTSRLSTRCQTTQP